MNDFEYFVAFFGVVLGLIVAEVAVKFADAIESHPRRPLGVLSPLLAVFILFDVTSFWLWLWSIRASVLVGWPTMIGSIVVAMAYFLSASLVFPRSESSSESLDHHYFKRKRQVLAGVLVANILLLGVVFSIQLPAWNDVWAWFWLAIYYLPLVALFFVRSRRWNILLLAILIGQYGLEFLPLPTSSWGNQIGINGDPSRPSTASPTVPK